MTEKHPIVPVILSGGAGTRLWPLSRASLPKQLLALRGERTMIQETALRVSSLSHGPLIVCNQAHRYLVAQQMQEIGIVPHAILLEPDGRNTAPASAVAALMAGEIDPRAIIVLLPSDHVISDQAAFLLALNRAIRAAEEGWLVTFGIAPAGPGSEFGYIQQGAALDGLDGTHRVERFVEKPDRVNAAQYLSQGGYFWNSGMFVFRADVMLRELEKHCADILMVAKETLAKSKRDSEFVRFDGESFRRFRNSSLDYAVMEHTDRAAVVPCDMGWSDAGSWSALWSLDAANKDQNVFYGDVVAENSTGSYVHSEDVLTTLVGVRDLVVVATPDAVLVADKARSQDVKEMVALLRAKSRKETSDHALVQKPWGSYQVMGAGDGFQIKQITVKPGGRLSLQMHRKRSEHWVVVQGTARVTCDDRIFTLNTNESAFIPLGAKHRLENQASEPLVLIEVQSGSYLGEDDIVRFEDVYGRVLHEA